MPSTSIQGKDAGYHAFTDLKPGQRVQILCEHCGRELRRADHQDSLTLAPRSQRHRRRLRRQRVEDAPLAELRAFAPGAVILFARNTGPADALRALVAELRALTPLPPLIAVDQEGGRVARIGDAVAQLPAAMAAGAAGDVAACERLGMLLGRDLARLGISVDFAPVADCALDPANTVIGTRAYGSDPLMVGRFAGAFARGLETGGVAAALKHFPGHGSTSVDSHLALPHVELDEATLRARDLQPFAACISAGAAQIVMAAHVVVDALDPCCRRRSRRASSPGCCATNSASRAWRAPIVCRWTRSRARRVRSPGPSPHWRPGPICCW